jgi:hypothetical protein
MHGVTGDDVGMRRFPPTIVSSVSDLVGSGRHREWCTQPFGDTFAMVTGEPFLIHDLTPSQDLVAWIWANVKTVSS